MDVSRYGKISMKSTFEVLKYLAFCGLAIDGLRSMVQAMC